MSSVQRSRWKYSKEVGLRTEDKFVSACQSRGDNVTKSSRDEDIKLHIDYYVMRKDQSTVSVDVKGGNHPNCIWVEFKNVRGDIGWMYGKADWIAFEVAEVGGFAMVKRSERADLSERIVEQVFVDKANADRKLYQRKDRKDVISRLWLEDIKQCQSYSVLKYSDPNAGQF
jgi:hypothetical protein